MICAYALLVSRDSASCVKNSDIQSERDVGRVKISARSTEVIINLNFFSHFSHR